jgi:uncharacterized membrane protein (UPF0127 family)
MRRFMIASLSTLSAISAHAGGGGQVSAKGQVFLAEVAVTDAERAKGLMYRQSLAKDRCMIFVYAEDGLHTIWMKNCLIALDVVWITADGTVVEVAEQVPPVSPMFRGSDADLPTYGGHASARHFVEFPSGTARRIGLKKGDRLGWDLTLDDGTQMKGGAPVGKKAVPAKKAGRKR